MIIKILLSTFLLSTFCVMFAGQRWGLTPSFVNANVSVAQADADRNSSAPGSSRGEERRSPASNTLIKTL
jgi:hypothetical protein